MRVSEGLPPATPSSAATQPPSTQGCDARGGLPHADIIESNYGSAEVRLEVHVSSWGDKIIIAIQSPLTGELEEPELLIHTRSHLGYLCQGLLDQEGIRRVVEMDKRSKRSWDVHHQLAHRTGTHAHLSEGVIVLVGGGSVLDQPLEQQLVARDAADGLHQEVKECVPLALRLHLTRANEHELGQSPEVAALQHMAAVRTRAHGELR